MKKVVTVIVTFNRVTKLKKVIEVFLQSKVSAIVIVNNASTDGTKLFLESIKDSRVNILTLKENVGGAGGFHEGIKYVHSTIKEYDWILVQDDDAYPDLDSLNVFMCSNNEIEVDAIISAVYYPSGNICEMNRPGFLPFKNFSQTITTILKGNKGFHLDDRYYQEKRPVLVDFASFVGMFISKRVVIETGFPDKSWFIYGDDLDYTTDFTKKGFKLVFNPNLVFYHDCESLNTNNPNQKSYTALWRTYFMYRNGIIIYKKLAGRLFLLVLLFKLVSWIIAIRKYPDALRYLKILAIAVQDGLLNNRQKNLVDVKKIIG